MSRIYLFSLYLFVWSPLAAQQPDSCNFALTGSVIDEHDQSRLAYATVFVKELNRGVVADSLGLYFIDKLCPGSYTITVSHVSCEPNTLSFDVRGSANKDLFLEHHIEALQNLTIEGLKLNDRLSSAPSERLDITVLERHSGNSLGDALQEITGISALKTGRTLVKPIIQGMYGSRILIINQGVRLQDMEWGEEHAPNVDINSASGLTLVKGASALRYGGDAIGGTIIIEPSSFLSDTLYGKTSVQAQSNGRGGAFNSELYLSGKTGWFTKVQASLKRFGDFKAPDYHLTNTGSLVTGVSLNAGNHKKAQGFDLFYSFFDADVAIMRASHIGNIDDLIQAINSQQPLVISDFSYRIDQPKQEVTHHLARIKYYRSLSKATDLEVQYDFQHNQRFEFDIRVGDDKTKAALDLELITHTVSGSTKLNKTSNVPLEVGVMYRNQVNFANPDTGIRRLIPDYNRNELAGFVTGTYHLSDHLKLDGGLRYDFVRIDAKKFYQTSRWLERGYDQDFGETVLMEIGSQILVNPIFDFHSFSGTIGANYYWGNNAELRINYALAQRAPNPSELFSDGLHQSASRIELGDLRIAQETSHKIGATIKNQKGRWYWELSPYFTLLNNYILLEPDGVEQTIRGAFPVWVYRPSDVIIMGLDARTSFTWNHHWVSDHRISYIYGQDTQLGRALINIPASNLKNKVTFQRLEWYGLRLSLESSIHFKQSRFPNNNFQAFLPVANTFTEVDISNTPRGYHLINLISTMELPVFGLAGTTFGFSINNLTNTKYRDYLNRLRFFGDEVGRSYQLSIKVTY